jgi:hypothetical protein
MLLGCAHAHAAPSTLRHWDRQLLGPVHQPCRYALYLPYLRNLLQQGYTGGVVLADARDVFIQADPWQHDAVQQLVSEVTIHCCVCWLS